jgi:hypothetical protein
VIHSALVIGAPALPGPLAGLTSPHGQSRLPGSLPGPGRVLEPLAFMRQWERRPGLTGDQSALAAAPRGPGRAGARRSARRYHRHAGPGRNDRAARPSRAPPQTTSSAGWKAYASRCGDISAGLAGFPGSALVRQDRDEKVRVVASAGINPTSIRLVCTPPGLGFESPERARPKAPPRSVGAFG